MIRFFPLLIVSLVLFFHSALSAETGPRLIEDYREPAKQTQIKSKESHLSYRSWVSLSLDEEYSGPTDRDQRFGIKTAVPGVWRRLTDITNNPRLLNTLVVIFFLSWILIAWNLYLKLRILSSLSKIPWEDIRNDPRVLRWPTENLFRKLHVWKFLKDLTRVKKTLHTRQLSPLLKKQSGDPYLTLKYIGRLKKVRCPGEACYLLAVLSVIGSARAVAPILNLLKRFPEDPDVTEAAGAALLGIRDAKVLTTLIPFSTESDPALFEIIVHVCSSYGESGIHMITRELNQQRQPVIRIGILKILGAMGDPNVIPVIEKYLLQDSEKERIAAAGALAAIGTQDAVEPLVHGLCHNPSPTVRSSIAQSLTNIPIDSTLSHLTQILETSPTYYFRIRAIEGLEALNQNPDSILDHALKDPHPKARAAAASALERMGIIRNELQRYLEDYSEERQQFLIQVGRTGIVVPFISALKTEESKSLKRIIRLIAHIGNTGMIPHLMELLETTTDWTVKSRLIPALAALQATEAIPLIIEHLQNKHHWVRKTAIDALGGLLSPDSSLRKKTLPIFHEALDDENPWTRASAIRVLTTLEDRSATPKFIELLTDRQTRVRVEAIRGLKWFHAMEAQEELIAMLDDPRQKVCAMAASAFGQFRSRRALFKLFEKFEDAKPLVRLAILEAVHQIDPMEADPLIRYLRTEEKGNLKVVSGLKDIISFNPSKILISLIKSGETRIRCTAIRSLAGLEDPEAEELYLSLLEDPETSIRAAAVDAIAIGENPNMAQALNEMRDDPDLDVRLRVILALGLIKNPETLPYLRNSLYDQDSSIRAHALMALFHYAEPQFLKYFLEQFREIKVRNILRKMVSNRKDQVVSLLVERIPSSKEVELNILKNHTLKSLDQSLEEQILLSSKKEEKLMAIMIAEILQRKKLKKALKQAITSDPHSEIRARALRAYAEISEIANEKDLIKQAIQDPALEVQTIASRLLIHIEGEPIESGSGTTP